MAQHTVKTSHGRQLTSEEALELLQSKTQRDLMKFSEPIYAFSEFDFPLIKEAIRKKLHHAVKKPHSTAYKFELRYFSFNNVKEVFISTLPRYSSSGPCGRISVKKVLSSDRL